MVKLNASGCSVGYFSRESKAVVPVLTVCADSCSEDCIHLSDIDIEDPRYAGLKEKRAVLENNYGNIHTSRLIIPLYIEDYHYGLAAALIENRVISQDVIAETQERFRSHALNILRCAVESISEAEGNIKIENSDPLTGLSPRRSVRERLNRMCKKSASGLLMLIDADDFKMVNYLAGFDGGDDVLIEMARTLKEELPGDAMVARFGDDEFLVLLEGDYSNHAEDLCKTVNRELSKIETDGIHKKNKLTASIGCVVISGQQECERDLLASAIEASVVAKRNGKNTYHIHSSKASKFPGLAKALKAIDERRVYYVHQPVIKMTDGKPDEVLYYEALARIEPGEKDGLSGSLPLNVFFSVLEENNYITMQDIQCAKTAIETIAFYDEQDIQIRIGVNVSSKTIGSVDFLSEIENHIELHQVNPNQLIIEITETATINHNIDSLGFIAHLRSLGCVIALDDFGSGNLSYEHLITLPVDIVKIDGALISEAGESDLHYAIVQNIALAAKKKNAVLVAECVENEAVMNTLKDIDIDAMQGYHFAEERLIDYHINPQNREELHG